MKQKGRTQRVAALVKQEIASLLMKGVKDPRLGFVSVMSVRMSPDLRYANVYVSLFGDESARKSSIIALRNSSGWIRREVGKKIRMRLTPEIRFFPDETLDQVYHLEDVFEQIHEEKKDTPMLALDLPGLIDELRGGESFLLTSHEHPDGDALGSVLGLYYFLRSLGKSKILCCLADPIPPKYKSLPGIQFITNTEAKLQDFEMAVILDVAQTDRIGNVVDHISPEHRLVCIDHHLGQGPSGAVGFIDASYAATAEIVFDMFAMAELPLTQEAAHCLYVGQTTDTGGFRFANTTARSHRIAASLVETGLDVAAISEEMFDIISAPKFELMRRVLDRVERFAGGRAAQSWVSAQDLVEAEGTREDLDGLVNYLRNIEGVQVALFFTALDKELVKVSARASQGFNAAEFLQEYGGGGHAGAAGATIEESLAQVQARLLADLSKHLEDQEEGKAGDTQS